YIITVLLSLQTTPPHRSTLFPYTTLFRSWRPCLQNYRRSSSRSKKACANGRERNHANSAGAYLLRTGYLQKACIRRFTKAPFGRSEEHTYELQSRENLVCRLLLEKKKI